MSITKLQEVRDTVQSQGVGLYLDVVKRLLAAIDEHIQEGGNIQSASDATLQAKASELQAKVAELEVELSACVNASKTVIVPEPTA